MEKEVMEEYRSSLAELTFNSKPLINMLTMLAEDHAHYAPQIVQVIETHLQKNLLGELDLYKMFCFLFAQAKPSARLCVIYLIDSIIKNLPNSRYPQSFVQNIVSTFVGVFEKVDEKTRQSMFKLRQTWNDIFPNKKMYAIDVRVNLIDPAWPVTAVAPEQGQGSIHVNPRFLIQPAEEPEEEATDSAEKQEVEMRQQLIAKQQELLKLQQQRLELELAVSQAKLEEQKKHIKEPDVQLIDVKMSGKPELPDVPFPPLQSLSTKQPAAASVKTPAASQSAAVPMATVPPSTRPGAREPHMAPRDPRRRDPRIATTAPPQGKSPPPAAVIPGPNDAVPQGFPSEAQGYHFQAQQNFPVDVHSQSSMPPQGDMPLNAFPHQAPGAMLPEHFQQAFGPGQMPHGPFPTGSLVSGQMQQGPFSQPMDPGQMQQAPFMQGAVPTGSFPQVPYQQAPFGQGQFSHGNFAPTSGPIGARAQVPFPQVNVSRKDVQARSVANQDMPKEIVASKNTRTKSAKAVQKKTPPKKGVAKKKETNKTKETPVTKTDLPQSKATPEKSKVKKDTKTEKKAKTETASPSKKGIATKETPSDDNKAPAAAGGSKNEDSKPKKDISDGTGRSKDSSSRSQSRSDRSSNDRHSDRTRDGDRHGRYDRRSKSRRDDDNERGRDLWKRRNSSELHDRSRSPRRTSKDRTPPWSNRDRDDSRSSMGKTRGSRNFDNARSKHSPRNTTGNTESEASDAGKKSKAPEPDPEKSKNKDDLSELFGSEDKDYRLPPSLISPTTTGWANFKASRPDEFPMEVEIPKSRDDIDERFSVPGSLPRDVDMRRSSTGSQMMSPPLASPMFNRSFSVVDDSVQIPQELTLERQEDVLKRAEKQLQSGKLTHEQHQEMLKQLSQVYEFQRFRQNQQSVEESAPDDVASTATSKDEEVGLQKDKDERRLPVGDVDERDRSKEGQGRKQSPRQSEKPDSQDEPMEWGKDSDFRKHQSADINPLDVNTDKDERIGLQTNIKHEPERHPGRHENRPAMGRIPLKSKRPGLMEQPHFEDRDDRNVTEGNRSPNFGPSDEFQGGPHFDNKRLSGDHRHLRDNFENKSSPRDNFDGPLRNDFRDPLPLDNFVNRSPHDFDHRPPRDSFGNQSPNENFGPRPPRENEIPQQDRKPLMSPEGNRPGNLPPNPNLAEMTMNREKLLPPLPEPFASDPRWRTAKGMFGPDNKEEVVIDRRPFEIKIGEPMKRIRLGGKLHDIVADAKARGIIFNGELIYKFGDTVVDARIHRTWYKLFYHGPAKVIWINGDPYEVRIDAPPRRITIEDVDHAIQIDGRDKMIMIDEKEMGVLGGPPRDIVIKDKTYNIRFDPPPRSILIDSKQCEIKLNERIPIVLIDMKPHGIRFDGPPRHVTINDTDYLVPMDHPVKIRLGNRPHYISFGGPAHEIILDGYWFEVKYGGARREIHIGNRTHIIQLKGELPPVMIMDEVKPLHIVPGQPMPLMQGQPGPGMPPNPQQQPMQIEPRNIRPGQMPQPRLVQPEHMQPGPQGHLQQPGQPGMIQPRPMGPGQQGPVPPGQMQGQPMIQRPTGAGVIQQGQRGPIPPGQPGQIPEGQMIQGQPGQIPQRPQGPMLQRQPGQIPQGQPGQMHQGQPGQMPQGQPGQMPQGQPGQMPHVQSGQMPQGQPGQMPQGQPGQIPQGQQGHMSQGQPGQMPQGQPGQIPQGQPGQMPLGQPGQMPQGQPGQMLPGQIPHVQQGQMQPGQMPILQGQMVPGQPGQMLPGQPIPIQQQQMLPGQQPGLMQPRQIQPGMQPLPRPPMPQGMQIPGQFQPGQNPMQPLPLGTGLMMQPGFGQQLSFQQQRPMMHAPGQMGAPQQLMPGPGGLPSVLSNLVQPTAPAASPLDMNSLFQKLLNTGIISKPSDASKDNASESEPAKTDVKADDTKELPDLASFRSILLKQRYGSVIQKMYSGIQCTTCGLRFAMENQEDYREHLDWHFRQNKRETEESKMSKYRKWYYSVHDWIQYEEVQERDKTGRSVFFEQMQPSTNEPLFSAPPEGSDVVQCPPATDNENADICVICSDPFEQYWDEEQEEWHLRDAVCVEDKLYHPVCYEDSKEVNILDVTPTPTDAPIINPLTVMGQPAETPPLTPVVSELKVTTSTNDALVDPTTSTNVASQETATPDVVKIEAMDTEVSLTATQTSELASDASKVENMEVDPQAVKTEPS